MSEDIKRKPLSIEQAANMLKERKGVDFKADAKKRMKDYQPGIEDSALTQKQLLALADKFIPEFPSQMKAAKGIVMMRIKGADLSTIAYHYRVPVQMLMRLEELGIEKIKRGIERDPCYKM